MIVIGTDTHKGSHALAAVDEGTGKVRGQRQIDALAIARAVVEDGVDSFAVAYLDEQAMEIRLLLDHRRQLVSERTRTINRLRWHLLELCPELEGLLKRRAFNQAPGAPLSRCDGHRPKRACQSRNARKRG